MAVPCLDKEYKRESVSPAFPPLPHILAKLARPGRTCCLPRERRGYELQTESNERPGPPSCRSTAGGPSRRRSAPAEPKWLQSLWRLLSSQQVKLPEAARGPRPGLRPLLPPYLSSRPQDPWGPTRCGPLSATPRTSPPSFCPRASAIAAQASAAPGVTHPC